MIIIALTDRYVRHFTAPWRWRRAVDFVPRSYSSSVYVKTENHVALPPSLFWFWLGISVSDILVLCHHVTQFSHFYISQMFLHTLPLYKIALELEILKYLNDLFTPMSLDDYQYNFKNIYINSYSVLFNNLIGGCNPTFTPNWSLDIKWGIVTIKGTNPLLLPKK